jgi:hypothetical protein
MVITPGQVAMVVVAPVQKVMLLLPMVLLIVAAAGEVLEVLMGIQSHTFLVREVQG